MGYHYRPQTKFAKVMFLYLSVNMFTGRGGVLHPGGSASKGGLHPGGLHQGALHRGGRTPPPTDTMGYDQRTGGTHPTLTHSYSYIQLVFRFHWVS